MSVIEVKKNAGNDKSFSVDHTISKAEKRPALISVKVRVSLPAVSQLFLHALINKNEFGFK